jgi:hypothetical protein
LHIAHTDTRCSRADASTHTNAATDIYSQPDDSPFPDLDAGAAHRHSDLNTCANIHCDANRAANFSRCSDNQTGGYVSPGSANRHGLSRSRTFAASRWDCFQRGYKCLSSKRILYPFRMAAWGALVENGKTPCTWNGKPDSAGPAFLYDRYFIEFAPPLSDRGRPPKFWDTVDTGEWAHDIQYLQLDENKTYTWRVAIARWCEAYNRSKVSLGLVSPYSESRTLTWHVVVLP